MRAPTDKSNDIIQICVTRKCDLFHCSNCTQLLPFRKDAVEMSVDCFRQALRSCAGWPGIVAMFGGNPCTHSRFPELCQIMKEEIPEQRHRGLWTNNLMQHGQVVKDTFWPDGRFNLNAHADEAAAAEIDRWLPGRLIESSRNRTSWHSPVLLDYRDFGITQEQWIHARENCDINIRWSSAIVEREGMPYAYFCEVAAALDGIRGENHGLPAVSGWWREKMPAFAHQVEQCCDRGCGIPLKGLGSLDRDDTYDISPAFIPLTVGRKVQTRVHETRPSKTDMPTDYQSRWSRKPVSA